MPDYRYQVPEGVRDILTDECTLKRKVEGQIRKVFRSYGFCEVSTPTFEYMDVFTSREVAVEQQDMFKLIDTSGRVLVMRPDVTVPIARMVATEMGDVTRPVKLFYISDVYRINRMQSSNQREFTQGGVEFIGAKNVEADGEVIASAIQALLDTGLDNFRIDIGQVAFFRSIIDEIDIPDRDKDMLTMYIHHKNLVAVEEFLDRTGVNGRYKELLLSIPVLYGNVDEILKRAMDFLLNERAAGALKDIHHVYDYVREYGFEKYLSVDLGMVSEFNYYTGITFKGFTRDLGYIICSGGRYDNLYAEFGQPCPATGFAINIDRVVEAIRRQQGNPEPCRTYYIVDYGAGDRKKAIDAARRLRNAGFYIELNTMAADRDLLVRYALEKGCKGVIEVGEGSRLTVIDTSSGLRTETSVTCMIKGFRDERSQAVSGWHKEGRGWNNA